METEIASMLLNFLLNNYFENKSDMARQLGLNIRSMQRILKNVKQAKGGTIALNHALCYCAMNHIALDPILEGIYNELAGITGDGRTNHNCYWGRRCQIQIDTGDLSSVGQIVCDTIEQLFQHAAAFFCPNCRSWSSLAVSMPRIQRGSCALMQLKDTMKRYVCAHSRGKRHERMRE